MLLAFVLAKDYQGGGSSPRGSQWSFSSVALEFRWLTAKNFERYIFLACALPWSRFWSLFFHAGEFLVTSCVKSYAAFSRLLTRRLLKSLKRLVFFNSATKWNTAAMKVLSLFKVGLMVCLCTCGWGKRCINGRIPGADKSLASETRY